MKSNLKPVPQLKTQTQTQQHETKVKEEGTSRRNITRKKNPKEMGNYDTKNKKQGGAG